MTDPGARAGTSVGGGSADAGPAAELAPVARLLGRLLVREIDAPTLAALEEPGVRTALAEAGVALPAAADLDLLATEYFGRFLHPPDGLPPVQSLWQGGQYEGPAAAAVRAIAAASGRELAGGARGAPPDHLGCILVLWADLVTERPELAALLARDHLGWAPRALASPRSHGGFYGSVAAAATAFVEAIAD